MKPTGVPDGANEMPKASRPTRLKISGESGPMNAAPDFSETKVEAGTMSDNLRKGATGNPVNDSAVPMEGGAQDAAKYGLGKGPYGAI